MIEENDAKTLIHDTSPLNQSAEDLQNIKKIEEGPFGGKKIPKKVSMPKKLKGGTRYCMLRGKRGTTFLVQFARPNDSIWDHKIL